jgi:hypothetical protein
MENKIELKDLKVRHYYYVRFSPNFQGELFDGYQASENIIFIIRKMGAGERPDDLFIILLLACTDKNTSWNLIVQANGDPSSPVFINTYPSTSGGPSYTPNSPNYCLGNSVKST